MSASNYDLAVLGAGSGGIAMAIRAARHGAKVALLEPGPLGGTCVNVGCVPKKAMWLAAELADAQQLASEVGFDVTPGVLDWPAFITQRDRYITGIHASYRRRFEELGITLIEARGRMMAADRIDADAREISAGHVLIATGARPQRLALPGAEGGIDSDGFFQLRACPKRAAIVGGGYIAVELAGVLRALGAEVTLYVRGPRLLRAFDSELAEALAGSMQGQGIRIVFGCSPVGASRDGQSHSLHFSDAQTTGGFDTLIWATGREPNSGDIGLERAGVEIDGKGFIVTDEWQNTTTPGVYAVGDVTGRLALTPVAIAASRRLADRVFGSVPDAKLDYANIATVVFSHPPLATVGICEQVARSVEGESVRVYRSRFRPMLGALAGREQTTFMKLVCAGADERIVGIHMIGAGVDEIVQGFAVALRMGARKADLDATVAIHPTAAEELVLMS